MGTADLRESAEVGETGETGEEKRENLSDDRGVGDGVCKALGGVSEKTGDLFACVTGQTDVCETLGERTVLSKRRSKRKQTLPGKGGGKAGKLGV